ncbi:MAG TPA: 3-hydroxyacyl-CoA dehydrogenase NAD-binding domain-containing protein [Spirochaetia bacterium]|nr:3-hydroxyacyl-CoA dehydrogenase NAD-binding domain-containing protein [Spirochaetia bacterium]
MYKVGVVGAGTMGAGIAQKMAQEGFSVILVDVQPDYVDKGIAVIRSMLRDAVEHGVFSQAHADRALERLTGTVDYDVLADADLVVEAVFEDLDVKGQVFKKLDHVCGPDTVLGTNTSSFLVHKIAAFTDRPERVLGMHYFYHPAKNRLLEIIPHQGTSQAALEKALLLGKLHGKTCIVVKDAPGFAVNRFFVPFLNESVRILQEGIADIATIEQAAKRAFSIGMGPFELMNVTGIPIAVHASTSLANELGAFYRTAELLKKQMESRKNWSLDGAVDETKVPAIMDRLCAATLGVAAHMVDEQVASMEDIDRGARIGLRWSKGPFELINRIGPHRVCEAAVALHRLHPDFAVPRLIEEHAATGKLFEFTYVDLRLKNDFAFITINRPEAMNALNPQVVDQLTRRLEEAENNPKVSSIVIQGAGKAFVAGADIGFFVENIREKRLDRTIEFTKKGHDLLLRLESSPKLTIAVVDGLSLGGGSELAFACQAIVATQAGTFGFPETGIGIFPGLGGMIRLTKQIGPELAKYYIFTGRILSAREALDLGIVTALAEPAKLDDVIRATAARARPEKYRTREIPALFRDRKTICSNGNASALLHGRPVSGVEAAFAVETARIIASKAPRALRMVDMLIDEGSKVSIREAIDMELARLEEIFSTQDALAGLQAPPGKAPAYQGK